MNHHANRQMRRILCRVPHSHSLAAKNDSRKRLFSSSTSSSSSSSTSAFPYVRVAAGLVAAPFLGAGLLMLRGGYYGKMYKPSNAERFLMIDADCSEKGAEVFKENESSTSSSSWSSFLSSSSPSSSSSMENKTSSEVEKSLPAQHLVVAHTQLLQLRNEAQRLLDEAVRYDFPGGKCGRTVSYAKLQQLSPSVICSFYRDFAKNISAALGIQVVPTQLSDKSSCSLLVYDQPGDFIDWHHDVNFYRGRHFTVLLPLIVDEGCDAQLQAVVPKGQKVRREYLTKNGEIDGVKSRDVEKVVVSPSVSQMIVAPFSDKGNSFPNAEVMAVPTVPGRIVIFEGAYVFHRVTPMGGGEAALSETKREADSAASNGKFPKRVTLSMTFTTDPAIDILEEATRRLKDMSYFGLGALL